MQVIEGVYGERTKIIFAVNTVLDKDAELMYVQLKLEQKVPVKQVQGCYKNELEVAYVALIDGISAKKYEQVVLVWDLCKLTNQESILLINNDDTAWLKYISGDYEMEKLGKFVTTSPADAMDNHDAWTRDGSTFWVCK